MQRKAYKMSGADADWLTKACRKNYVPQSTLRILASKTPGSPAMTPLRILWLTKEEECRKSSLLTLIETHWLLKAPLFTVFEREGVSAAVPEEDLQGQC